MNEQRQFGVGNKRKTQTETDTATTTTTAVATTTTIATATTIVLNNLEAFSQYLQMDFDIDSATKRRLPLDPKIKNKKRGKLKKILN